MSRSNENRAEDDEIDSNEIVVSFLYRHVEANCTFFSLENRLH